MTDREERAFDAVDELVKKYMAQEVEAADSSELIARIGETRQSSTARVRNARGGQVIGSRPMSSTGKSTAKRSSPALTWVALTLLAVCGAFMGGRLVGPHSASAAVVLRDVGWEHAREIDRCYRVQYSPDPRYFDGKNKLEGPSSSVLWTRGDRFWADCTIGDVHIKVGRDSEGVLWVSPSPTKGIRFTNDATHLPEDVAQLCAINSMSVPRLIDEVLADFVLHSEKSVYGENHRERTIIWARLKPGRTHPLLSDALLEIDSETNVLNRLVLWTVRNGQPKGIVTYTLIDSSTAMDNASQRNELYRLESHLESGAEIEAGTLTMPSESLADPAS